jgi:hypothetical protein
MVSGQAMAPVLESVRKALQGGHRVFWAGNLFVPKAGEVPLDPPPAPRAPWGWSDGAYNYYWALQAGYLLREHAGAAARIDVHTAQQVSDYEQVPLYVMKGWRPAAGSP